MRRSPHGASLEDTDIVLTACCSQKSPGETLSIVDTRPSKLSISFYFLYKKKKIEKSLKALVRPMKLTNIIHDYLSCAPKTLTNKNTIQYELTRERFILIIVSATIYIFFLSRPLIHNQTRARLHAACQRMFRQSTGASKYFVRVNPTRED